MNAHRQQRIDLGLGAPHAAVSAAAARSSSPQPPPGRKHARDLRWCTLKEGDPRLNYLRQTQDDYTLEDSFHAFQDPLGLGIAERAGYDEAPRRKATGLPSLKEELGAWLAAGCPLELEDGRISKVEPAAAEGAEEEIHVPEEVFEDEEMDLPGQLEDLYYRRLEAVRRGNHSTVEALERETAALVRKHYPLQAYRLPERMDPGEVDLNMLSEFSSSPLMEALYAVGYNPSVGAPSSPTPGVARASFQEPLASPPRTASPPAAKQAPWAPKKLAAGVIEFGAMPLSLIMYQEKQAAAASRSGERAAVPEPASGPRMKTWSRAAAARHGAQPPSACDIQLKLGNFL